jgi:hypothetical protein
MKDKEICVNVYAKNDSKIIKTIKSIEKDLKDYTFSFFNIEDPPPPQKVIGALIIIEEHGINEIFSKYKEIINSYKYEPFYIISSEKPDYRNAVKWMKNDARDYIDSNQKYTVNEFKKILDEAFSILNIEYFEEKADDDPFSYPPVKIISNCKWDTVEGNMQYDMTVLMLSIILKEENNIYAKEDLERILKKIEDYASSIVTSFGGKKLFWNYDNGMFIFYFGDRVNSATLASILILNKLKIFIFETLSLYELFDIKIALHDGKINYYRKNAKFITSDTINSVVHLHNNIKYLNSIDITENVYENLNPRVKMHFFEDSVFEGRSIYTYYYNYFSKK